MADFRQEEFSYLRAVRFWWPKNVKFFLRDSRLKDDEELKFLFGAFVFSSSIIDFILQGFTKTPKCCDLEDCPHFRGIISWSADNVSPPVVGDIHEDARRASSFWVSTLLSEMRDEASGKIHILPTNFLIWKDGSKIETDSVQVILYDKPCSVTERYVYRDWLPGMPNNQKQQNYPSWVDVCQAENGNCIDLSLVLQKINEFEVKENKISGEVSQDSQQVCLHRRYTDVFLSNSAIFLLFEFRWTQLKQLTAVNHSNCQVAAFCQLAVDHVLGVGLVLLSWHCNLGVNSMPLSLCSFLANGLLPGAMSALVGQPMGLKLIPQLSSCLALLILKPLEASLWLCSFLEPSWILPLFSSVFHLSALFGLSASLALLSDMASVSCAHVAASHWTISTLLQWQIRWLQTLLGTFLCPPSRAPKRTSFEGQALLQISLVLLLFTLPTTASFYTVLLLLKLLTSSVVLGLRFASLSLQHFPFWAFFLWLCFPRLVPSGVGFVPHRVSPATAPPHPAPCNVRGYMSLHNVPVTFGELFAIPAHGNGGEGLTYLRPALTALWRISKIPCL